MKSEVNNKKISKFGKLALIFFIGCIIGWIYEEIFYLVTEGILENRGFLYGPYLPVYGFGSLFIYLLLNRFKKYPWLIFLLSIFVTGILEYFTGYWLYKLYNRNFWTYEGLFLNIDGYVCLRSALSFALGALGLIYFAIPLLDKFINKIGNKKTNIISIAILIVMGIDSFISLFFKY